MKKYVLILLLVVFTKFSFGQVTTPDTTKKEFKNVISVDATGLLRQFFNFNNYTYFYNPYMISYRRVFKNNAFRISVGGNFDTDKSLQNDTLPNKRTTNEINIGIGFEHYCYLSEKWNFYFGADAVMNYNYHDYQNSWTMTHYGRLTTTTYEYGVSPLLGLQFKINSRLSLSTETMYQITYTTSKSSDIETPYSNYDRHSKSNGIKSQFIPPTMINFRIIF